MMKVMHSQESHAERNTTEYSSRSEEIPHSFSSTTGVERSPVLVNIAVTEERERLCALDRRVPTRIPSRVMPID